MSQYAGFVAETIAALRARNPKTFIVWGGVHPIVNPNDAIRHADAICTGEGEYPFVQLLSARRDGRPYLDTPSFWFNTDDGIVKNKNIPLMKNEEMDQLPLSIFPENMQIYRHGKGFHRPSALDIVNHCGLAYHTVWSVGCPFRCTYCQNDVFVDYDKNYRKIRHSSPEAIVNEIVAAKKQFPHISSVVFHDDSFMALPLRVLEEFAGLYKDRVGLPFAVFGVIPNYVREEKIDILVRAGMIRVRMGIQSGSPRILEFYDRATPLSRIMSACVTLQKFDKYMIPPSFDIIVDNPIETQSDVQATLDLLYEMPRPYTLNIFSLRAHPDTRLERQLADHGVTIADMQQNVLLSPPTIANMAILIVATVALPRKLYDMLRKRALPSSVKQPLYPYLQTFFRILFMTKRALYHLRYLDFAVFTGPLGYFLWKAGIISFWQRHLLPKKP